MNALFSLGKSGAASLVLVACLLGIVGCASLLPETETRVKVLWNSYAEAEADFERIIPGQTTVDELRRRGVDPASSNNITILNYTDLLRRFVVVPSLDSRVLDESVRECLENRERCIAWVVEQTFLHKKRTGDFVPDFLNFHRKTETTGWRFEAILVINGDKVVYKLWSGKPNILEHEEQKNPLGPLQGTGESGTRHLLNL